MNDSALPTPTTILSAVPVQAPEGMPQLDRSRNGYQIDQVHGFVHSLMDHIRDLEAQLAHAARSLPRHALQAAESPQGQQMLADIIKLAADEISGKQAQAQADIARMMADATRQATQRIDEARQESAGVMAGAREQADVIISNARGDAKRMLDEAAARATAVDEGAGQRLQALIGRHGETLQRLTQIHQVTGQLLQADDERGSLADEVTRLALPGRHSTGEQLAELPGN